MIKSISAIYCMVTLAGVSLAAAQSEPPHAAVQVVAPYRVMGTVVDNGGSPVFSAEVGLIERDSVVRRVRSDSAGKFTLDALTAPELTLRVRRVGYQPQELTVRVTKAGRTATVFVQLERAVAALDTVRVADDSAPEPVNPRLIAFRERASTNSFGKYITEEMLARLRPHNPSDAFRGVSGVIIRPAPPRRYGNIVRLRGCGLPGKGESPEKVGPLIWLDGVRLPGAEIDEVTTGDDIAAIEIYPSFSGVPAQYFDRTAVCGTILIWTKSK